MLSWEGNYIIKRGWGLRKKDDKKIYYSGIEENWRNWELGNLRMQELGYSRMWEYGHAQTRELGHS